MNSFKKEAKSKADQPIWKWRDLAIVLIGTFLFLVVGVILIIIINVAQGANPEDLLEPTITQTISLTALEAVALIGGVYIFGLRRKGLDWNAVGIRPASSNWYLIAFVVTIMVIPLASLITLAVFFVSGQPLENPQLDFLLPEDLSTIDAFVMLILAGFIAPLGEELLFRGVLYSLFRERWGIWISVLLSSLLFAIIHGNIAVGLTGFLLGIVAAIVFEYSGSLWTAVLVHSVNNSLKIGLLYILVNLGIRV